jgi:NTE family protein
MPAKPAFSVAYPKPAVALVLQGGGALGAYHIGAYEALAEHGFHPDWVCGISIGAINSAIIAGNHPDQRVARLDALWETISWPDIAVPLAFPPLQLLHNMASNAIALLAGQPHFFAPRPVNPFLVPQAPPQMVSFYDTTPMLGTLQRFADFDLINRGRARLSLGATNIATGNLEFFDNQRMTIRPEHVLASGSLPPGFAAVPIGNAFYWDGGCVSNTPLDAIVDDPSHPRLVAFVIDLWDAAGTPPRSMNEALWRAKQIQYASRLAHEIDAVATKVNLRHAMRLLKAAAVPEVAAVPDDPALTECRLDIVHIVYHPAEDQIPNSDAEFSRSSIAARRAAGYRDMKKAFEEAPWLRREMPAHLGALVHRVKHEKVTTLPEPNLRTTTDKPIRPPAVA